LCLQYGNIPAQLHFRQLNPKISFDGTRIAIPLSLQPWPDGNLRRLAGVSSFGFGGTNAHLVIEGSPRNKSSLRSKRERSTHILALSAKSQTALRTLADRYVQHLASHPGLSVPDLCFTANEGRSQFSHRLSVVCKNQEQLRQRMESFLAGQRDVGV